jgi:RNA polymerase sigma-70 factor, ECF subfamily
MRALSETADATTRPTTFDLETVFDSHYKRIARIVGRIIGDPSRAEDLAVEAFWRLWRTPLAQGDNAGGWLYRTAVRLAIDELRMRARQARYEPLLNFFSPSPRTPHDLLFTDLQQAQVRAVLASLRPTDAELLLLRSDGLPYDELAAVLSLNPASVGTLLSRAKAAFRKEYVKRYGEQ